MTDEEPDAPGEDVASAVGIAVGYAGAFSIHEPLERVMALLRSGSRVIFAIWSPS
jgi:hypothetical protein